MTHTAAPQGPLAGLKVLDFTWVVAGPMATRMLADWGASVYRIEWPQNPDSIRFMLSVGKQKTPEDTWEKSGIFNDLNSGKSSMTLNMKDDRGRAIFIDMLKQADVVVENFSPSAMEKWGLDYEAMKAINPRIIYMSLSGFGHSGPHKYYLTYGPSAQALSGLTHASGLPETQPAGWGFSYMDQTGGYVGCLALLMAIFHRDRTGEGQYLDLSQGEAGMALTGAALLDYTVNGRKSRRPGFPPGNRQTWPGHPITDSYRSDPTVAPHNSYRTAGDDHNAWCVIACFTGRQFEALCAQMGQAKLADDPRFATLAARLANQAELDAIIEAWTSTLDKYVVMDRLQAFGVPAAAVQSSKDRVLTDPQLRHDGVHVELEHELLGKRIHQSLPTRMSLTPPATRKPAPLVGADNERLMSELLGYDAAKVAELVDEGVLWPTMGFERPAWIKGAPRKVASVDADEQLVPGE